MPTQGYESTWGELSTMFISLHTLVAQYLTVDTREGTCDMLEMDMETNNSTQF